MFTKSKTFYNYKYEYIQFVRSISFKMYGIRLIVSNKDRFTIYNALCENFDSRYIQIYLKDELCGIFNIKEFYVSTSYNNLLIVININEELNNYFKTIKDLSKTLKFEYIIEHNFGDFKLYI